MTPQVATSQPITDIVNWTLVVDTIDGADQDALIIGNFQNDDPVNFIEVNSGASIIDPTFNETWYVAYYYIDHVFVEPAHVKNFYSLCPDDCVILTSSTPPGFIDNPAIGYHWNVSTVTTPTITYCPTEAGTTLITCTTQDFLGCTIIDSFYVTMNPEPVKPEIAGPFHNCQPGIQILSHYYVTNPQAGTSYEWTFPHGEGSYMTPAIGPDQVDILWNDPFTVCHIELIVTATDESTGCSSSDTLIVYQCCDENIFNYPQSVVFSWTDQTIAPIDMSPYYNPITHIVSGIEIVINGTVYFDADVIFQACKFWMGPYSKVYIKSGRTVKMTDVTIVKSCDMEHMWDAFIIEDNTAELIADKRCEFYDGRNAIVSMEGGKFNIDNCTFDLNNVSLLVKSHFGSNLASYFTNNTVECTAPALMLFPYTGSRSFCGVKIDTNSLVKIGPSNRFNRLQNGILSFRSGAIIDQNFFNYNLNLMVLQYSQVAVKAIGITPGLTLDMNNNKIESCFTGISAEGLDLNIDENYIKNILTNGIFYTNVKNHTVIINYNSIENAGIGIFAYMPGTSTSTISHNSIKWTAGWNGIGIRVNEATISTNSLQYIQLNEIKDARYGIECNNLFVPQIKYNDIKIINNGNSSSPVKGISISGCYGANVGSNYIEASTSNEFVGGIYASQSPVSKISCNNIRKTGYAIQCSGPMQSSTIFNNTMTNCDRGVWLYAGAIIGQQGDATHPSYNKWIGNFTDHILSSGTLSLLTDGTQSPFYVRSNPPFFYPSLNHFSPPSIPVTIANAVGQPYSPACTMYLPNANIILQHKIAKNQLAFPTGELRWMANHALYSEIINDSSLLFNDSILPAYKDSIESTTLGELHQISKIIVTFDDPSELYYAFEANNAIVATNGPEQILVDLNRILIEKNMDAAGLINAASIEQLRYIANLCPFEYGAGVYTARAVLSALDSVDYINDCEISFLIPGRSVELLDSANVEVDYFTVYPNPSAGTLTIENEVELSENVEFDLMDLTGRLILSKFFLIWPGQVTFDLGGTSEGIYIYKIARNGQTVKTDKLIIIR